MTIPVYVIDVTSATISEHHVKRSESERAVCLLLNAPHVKKLQTGDGHIVIFAKPDRRDPTTSVCFIDGVLVPGIGKLVITGADGETMRGPLVSIDDFAERVEVTRPALDPVELMDGQRKVGFAVRLVREKATVKSRAIASYRQ